MKACSQLQSCSWSVNRENAYFPTSRSRLITWSRETGSAVPSRVSPLILHTQAESDWLMMLTYSRDSSRFPRRRPFLYIPIPPSAIGSVPSLADHANAYRWRSLPPRVSLSQHKASIIVLIRYLVSLGNGFCLSRCHHGLIFVRLSFPPPTFGMYHTIEPGEC